MPHKIPASELELAARREYKLKQYEAALRATQEAIHSDDGPTVSQLDLRAAIYEKLLRYDAAMQDAKAILRADQTSIVGYLRAVRISCALHKSHQALGICARGLRMVPVHCIGRDYLVLKYEELKAVQCATRVCDPFPRLPVEIALMVLERVSFVDICRCLRVSKSWHSLIKSLPSLWMRIDLTTARRPVSTTFITSCINRSRQQLRNASLYRVMKLSQVVSVLAGRCPQLDCLHLKGNFTVPADILQSLYPAKQLKTLRLDAHVHQKHIIMVLQQCSHLRHLECSLVEGEPALPGRHAPVWNDITSQLETLVLVADARIHGHLHPLQSLDMDGVIHHGASLKKLVLHGLNRKDSTTETDMTTLHNLEDLSLVPHTPSTFHLPTGLRCLNVGAQAIPQVSILPRLERLVCSAYAQLLRIFPSSTDLMDAPAQAAEPCPLQSVHIRMSLGVVEAYSRLKEMTQLNEVITLRLDDTFETDDLVVPWILTCCTAVEVLHLFNSDITGYGLKQLVKGLAKFRLLRLDNCKDLGEDAVDWAKARGIFIQRNWIEDGGMPPRGLLR